MSFFDDLDAHLNDNSLDNFLLISPVHSEPSIFLYQYSNVAEDKQLCGTNIKISDDEELSLQKQILYLEDCSIDRMKSARAQQEQKVRKFIAKIQPVSPMTRKSSSESSYEIESPKTKKIRKMTSYK